MPQCCSVEPKHKPPPRTPRPVSLAGLAARVSRLEAVHWTGEAENASKLAATVPSLVEATNLAQARLGEAQRTEAARLEEKLATFGHWVKTTLAAMQQQRAEETHAASTAAAADARSSAQELRDLEERQLLLEAKIAALMQDGAVRMVKAANGQGPVQGGPSALHPATAANAAAEAAAAAATKALGAAEAAEVAASAGTRSLEAVVARQQKSLDEAGARERRLMQQLDALSAAMAEQGRAHAEMQRTLAARIDTLELAAAGHLKR